MDTVTSLPMDLRTRYDQVMDAPDIRSTDDGSDRGGGADAA